MRRNEREIYDREEMEAIIQRAQVCRIGLSEKDVPYIVPMDFGYEGNCLYFHCASEGKKLDMIRQNSKVCFEMDIDHQMVKPAGRPCGWSAKYRSGSVSRWPSYSASLDTSFCWFGFRFSTRPRSIILSTTYS